MQKGGGYDFLENAFLDWSTMVYLPNRLCAALSAIRHIRMGATTLHHTGWNDEGPNAIPEAKDALKAYADIGMRVAYSPAVRNRNRFCVGEEEFVGRLPEDLAAWVRPQIAYDKQKIADDYFALFETLHADHDGPHEPGVPRPVLGARHDRTVLRAHPRQRGEARRHPDPHPHPADAASARLRLQGLRQVARPVSRRARADHARDHARHAVWLSEDDIALLAARGAGTTHHPSCNLHVRNGISPIHPMIRAGVRVAIGIDDKSINDDDDIVMELRLAHMLSRVPSFDLGASKALAPHEIWTMGTTAAATALGFGGEIGALAPGMKADVIVLDTEEMMRDPWQSPRLPVPELVLMRGKGVHTRHAVIDGRIVMEDRRFPDYDVEALNAEVRAYVERFEGGPPDRTRLAMLERIRPHFHAWHAEVLTHLDVANRITA